MYKYIVFDFDGTLVDSRAVFVAVYNEIAAKQGFLPITDEDLGRLRGLSVKERCRYLKVPMYRIPLLVPAFLKKYRALVPTLQFNPGMKELLDGLSAKQVPLAMLSSNSKDNIDDFFGLHGISVGDIYNSSKLFGKDKVLRRLLKEKGLRPSEILYVGDEARDIIACKSVGVPVAWVSWGYDAEVAISEFNPDYLIHTPEELLQVIYGE